MPGVLLKEGAAVLSGSRESSSALIPSGAVLGARWHTFYVCFGKDSQAGAVTFESGPDGFAGQWVTEGVVRWKGANKLQRITVEGPFMALRLRISEPVIGGVVDVYGCAM